MLKANIGLDLIKGYQGIEDVTKDAMTDRTLSKLKRQAGIIGETALSPGQAHRAADSVVNGSFKNATFSDRIWANQTTLKSDLEKLLTSGMIQGKNPRELARELRKRVDVSRTNAERLMITELARAQTEAQKLSFEKNGFKEYKFLAEPTACPICKAIDDRVFPVAKMMPGENAPPMHPYCRCSTSTYMRRPGEDDTIKIATPGSTKSFRKSLESIRAGKAGLDKRRSNILERLPEQNTYARLEHGSISNRDLAYLSAATHDEFALFRSKAEDVLFRGDQSTCNITGAIAEEMLSGKFEWIAHTHTDLGPLVASREDKETLKRLNQKRSYIIGVDGSEKPFTQNG